MNFELNPKSIEYNSNSKLFYMLDPTPSDIYFKKMVWTTLIVLLFKVHKMTI